MTAGKMTAVGGIQEMDNPERLKYFGVIDDLRGLGVNEELPLPQIVVVGDQSSGKSSLLEGLTGLSFPIASDLCTRFATQIVLQRTPGGKAAVKASIVPGASSRDDEEQKRRLLEFDTQMDADELSGPKFASILNKAAEYMGLPTSDNQDNEDLEKRFSDDILRIEISGPDEHHLSVVDVPGLFHNPTKFQTREDLTIIRKLIEDYTTDERTIILAVMDARNNLANQEVFKMARAADPAGIRTVGIITKCDALQSGDEQGVLKIAQNSVERLQHGWFVVRNRSTKEILEGVTIPQRHENEKRFFQQAPWNELPRDRVGVKALKPFLGQLLYEHIRREFPALMREIEDLVRETEREVKELGAPRQTAADQRQYLTRLASRYQRNVEDALKGNYAADLDTKSPLKLRMHLRDLADQFEEDLRSKGHTSPFQHPDGSVDKDYLNEDAESEAPDIREWIQERYRDARGAELPGMVNPTLLVNLFREQTIQWERIAGDYLEQVIQLVTKYSELESRRTEADETIRASLDSKILAQIEITKASAKQRLVNLLQDERGGILQTVNHYFAETLAKLRQDRVVARLQALGLRDDQPCMMDLAKLTSTIHLSNEDQAVNDIHDALKAYYKVAIKRFGDYVVISVVERFIGDQGALKFFSSEYVGGLSDQQLAAMAAESYATSTARVELEHRCQRYREALRVARRV
ncbi:P-loop containing nucleoside triphosphate hydrolase protein [Trichoderma longibrachiatum]